MGQIDWNQSGLSQIGNNLSGFSQSGLGGPAGSQSTSAGGGGWYPYQPGSRDFGFTVPEAFNVPYAGADSGPVRNLYDNVNQVDVRTKNMRSLEEASLPMLLTAMLRPEALASMFGSVGGGVPGAAGFNPANNVGAGALNAQGTAGYGFGNSGAAQSGAAGMLASLFGGGGFSSPQTSGAQLQVGGAGGGGGGTGGGFGIPGIQQGNGNGGGAGADSGGAAPPLTGPGQGNVSDPAFSGTIFGQPNPAGLQWNNQGSPQIDEMLKAFGLGSSGGSGASPFSIQGLVPGTGSTGKELNLGVLNSMLFPQGYLAGQYNNAPNDPNGGGLGLIGGANVNQTFGNGAAGSSALQQALSTLGLNTSGPPPAGTQSAWTPPSSGFSIPGAAYQPGDYQFSYNPAEYGISGDSGMADKGSVPFGGQNLNLGWLNSQLLPQGFAGLGSGPAGGNANVSIFQKYGADDVGSAGNGNDLASLLQKLGVQFRAGGGPLDPNTPTIVGEQGPEMLLNGQVTPLTGAAARQLPVGGGNGSTMSAPLFGSSGGPEGIMPTIGGVNWGSSGDNGSLQTGAGLQLTGQATGASNPLGQLPGLPQLPQLGGFQASALQGAGTGSAARMLDSNPEQKAFDTAFSQIGTGANPGQGVVNAMQPVFQQNLQSSFAGLRNLAPSVFNSQTGLEGANIAQKSLNDFNLLAAQALQQGQAQQTQNYSVLGQLAGQAGNGAFNRALGAGQLGLQESQAQTGANQAAAAGNAQNALGLGSLAQQGYGAETQRATGIGGLANEQLLGLRNQDIQQQLSLLQLAQQQQQFMSNYGLQAQNQAYNQAVNPTLQLLLAALGQATPTAYQTVVQQ